MKVVHIISGLGIGGAERMLQRLCEQHEAQKLFNTVVVSLSALGPIGQQLRDDGLRVEALGMSGFASLPATIRKLRTLLVELKPDLVQSWLYRADLIAGLALRKGWSCPLAWNLRCTFSGSSLAARGLVRVNSQLSRTLPDSIVCCGTEVARFHTACGFDAGRMTVLPNGFDIDYFTPPTRQQHTGCRFLAIGREDALKDYPTLIRAFALVANENPNVSLTICGKNIPRANAALVSELDLASRIHLHDSLSDVREAMREADVYCSSSTNEGFPNVIGEAMLMELPVVATDAGDTAEIVGDCGTVVPPSNIKQLAEAMQAMAAQADEERRVLGAAARRRVTELFEIGRVARLYADHYCALIADKER